MASPIHRYDLTTQAAAPQGEAVKPASPDKSVTQDAFLKLLVAQIRNQNPLSPADGIQFLTQLAQFSELEQLIGMRQDLEAIRGSLAPGGDSAADSTSETKGV